MTLAATLAANVDNDVVFSFHVTNVESDPITLTFRSGKTAEVTVSSTDTGKTVWTSSAGKMYTQAIEHETLDSGQHLECVYCWEQPPTGTYTAEANLAADTEASAKTTFTI